MQLNTEVNNFSPICIYDARTCLVIWPQFCQSGVTYLQQVLIINIHRLSSSIIYSAHSTHFVEYNTFCWTFFLKIEIPLLCFSPAYCEPPWPAQCWVCPIRVGTLQVWCLAVLPRSRLSQDRNTRWAHLRIAQRITGPFVQVSHLCFVLISLSLLPSFPANFHSETILRDYMYQHKNQLD